MTARPNLTPESGSGAVEKSLVAAITTVQFAAEHNVLSGGESSVMQNARRVALRLGHTPGTRAYLEFVNGCLEMACKTNEAQAPDVKPGWLVLPRAMLEQITAEVHFRVDDDGDIAEVEVWCNRVDLWMLLDRAYQNDIERQIHEALPGLLRQADREVAEDRAESRRWDLA